MNIDFQSLSDAELAASIASAAAELSRRLHEGGRMRCPAVVQVPVVDEPTAEEKDFALYVAGLSRAGKYVKAHERHRLADIAARYPAWIKKQGLPSDASAGEWNRARSYLSARRERER